MIKYLFGAPIDFRVSRFLISRGHPYQARFLNKIMIVFKDRPGFVEICTKRFWYLLCIYKHYKSPITLFLDLGAYHIHNNSFWNKAIESFKSGTDILTFTGHKSNTRKKLYMLGHLFGYNHVISGQTEYEKWGDRRGRIFYSEKVLEKVGSKDYYTLKELKRMRILWPDVWEETDKFTDTNEVLYKVKDGVYPYKRGYMVNSPGTIVFTKSTVSVTNSKLFDKVKEA